MIAILEICFIYVFYLFSINDIRVRGSDLSPTQQQQQPQIDEAFFTSSRYGDVNSVLKYIKQGIDVSGRDSKGNTAIIIASGRGQVEVMKILLDHGANQDDCTNVGLFQGKSALSWAASQGRSNAVALLLNSGANPHIPASKGVFLGKTPLMWASSQGRIDVVRLLLASDVDVNYASNVGNFKGKNSLMWASSQGRLDIVTLLLEAGAEVNAMDSDGVTAVMWASGSEASNAEHKKGLLEKPTKDHIEEIVQKLLQYGAMADMRDKDGITALMYACFHGYSKAVLSLLNFGADASIKNKAGKTALQLAINAGFYETARVLYAGPNILSLPIDAVFSISTCGWLLSVLRSPYGTGIYPIDATKSHANFTLATACSTLSQGGLDTVLGDFLAIVHEAGIDEILNYLGIPNIAAKMRAKTQLKTLMERFDVFKSESKDRNKVCFLNGRYSQHLCSSGGE